MKNKERLTVFIKYENEKTVCICKRSNKLCDHPCEVEIVERDKFYDIKKVFSQDKYTSNNQVQKEIKFLNKKV